MTLQTLEITRDEWLPFFDAFSGMHRGWLVTLEVRGESFDAEVRAAGVPFEEIAAEGGRDGDRISIVLRPNSADEINHVVESPAHVWLRQEEALSDAALEIQSARGTTTLLKFTAADLPRPAEGTSFWA